MNIEFLANCFVAMKEKVGNYETEDNMQSVLTVLLGNGTIKSEEYDEIMEIYEKGH